MMHAALGSAGMERAESPGLWVLAWRRFCRDRLGLVAFVVVLFFFALMAASGLGLIAADWSKEVGVSDAPPTFIGPSTSAARPAAAPAAVPDSSRGEGKGESSVVDPLADVLSDIRHEKRAGTNDTDIVDPLADVLAQIRRESGGASAAEARAPTLVFGGDKWGRDVLKKAIKGTETSMFVGLGRRRARRVPGHGVWSAGGLLRTLDRRFLQLVLQRLHVDPLSAADSGHCRGAEPERDDDGDPDPRA